MTEIELTATPVTFRASLSQVAEKIAGLGCDDQAEFFRQMALAMAGWGLGKLSTQCNFIGTEIAKMPAEDRVTVTLMFERIMESEEEI